MKWFNVLIMTIAAAAKNGNKISNNGKPHLINSSNQQFSNDEQSNSDELLIIKYCITFNFSVIFYKTIKPKLTPALVLSLHTKPQHHFLLGKSFKRGITLIN